MYGQNKAGGKLADVIDNEAKYTFGDIPLVLQDDASAGSGSDTEANFHLYSDGLKIHSQNIGGQTIFVPVADARGMDYSFDATNDEGNQWVHRSLACKGYDSGSNIDGFIVGGKKFFCELTLYIADVSGTDDCLFGLRKQEAFQAAVDGYDEMAAFNIISGDLKTETILNNAATVTTDTTDDIADASQLTLRIDVDEAGAVTYKYNGSAPSAVAAFSFDVGEVVSPFFYLLQNGTDTAGVVLVDYSLGIVE
tara:strand:+ start:688 stop:1440 length:753 start_codon:yes stop_codon:yes gene_type:complete